MYSSLSTLSILSLVSLPLFHCGINFQTSVGGNPCLVEFYISNINGSKCGDWVSNVQIWSIWQGTMGSYITPTSYSLAVPGKGDLYIFDCEKDPLCETGYPLPISILLSSHYGTNTITLTNVITTFQDNTYFETSCQLCHGPIECIGSNQTLSNSSSSSSLPQSTRSLDQSCSTTTTVQPQKDNEDNGLMEGGIMNVIGAFGGVIMTFLCCVCLCVFTAWRLKRGKYNKTMNYMGSEEDNFKNYKDDGIQSVTREPGPGLPGSPGTGDMNGTGTEPSCISSTKWEENALITEMEGKGSPQQAVLRVPTPSAPEMRDAAESTISDVFRGRSHIGSLSHTEYSEGKGMITGGGGGHYPSNNHHGATPNGYGGTRKGYGNRGGTRDGFGFSNSKNSKDDDKSISIPIPYGHTMQ